MKYTYCFSRTRDCSTKKYLVRRAAHSSRNKRVPVQILFFFFFHGTRRHGTAIRETRIKGTYGRFTRIIHVDRYMTEYLAMRGDMYHTSRGVPLKVSQRCVLSSLAPTRFRSVNYRGSSAHELVPCPRRCTPAVIKIFKKLCTLKHFMAFAARLLRATYASYAAPFLARARALPSPTLRRRCSQTPFSPSPTSSLTLTLSLSYFFSRAAKAASPTGPARNTPSFYNPTSLMLASNF